MLGQNSLFNFIASYPGRFPLFPTRRASSNRPTQNAGQPLSALDRPTRLSPGCTTCDHGGIVHDQIRVRAIRLRAPAVRFLARSTGCRGLRCEEPRQSPPSSSRLPSPQSHGCWTAHTRERGLRRGHTREQAAEASRETIRQRSHGPRDSTPGNFDFYVLSLSWSPYLLRQRCRPGQSRQCGTGKTVRPGWCTGSGRRTSGVISRIARARKASACPTALRGRSWTSCRAWGLIGHQWRKHGTARGFHGRLFRVVRQPMTRSGFRRRSQAAAALQISPAALELGIYPQQSRDWPVGSGGHL